MLKMICSSVTRASSNFSRLISAARSETSDLICVNFEDCAFHVSSNLVLIPSRSKISLTAYDRQQSCVQHSSELAGSGLICSGHKQKMGGRHILNLDERRPTVSGARPLSSDQCRTRSRFSNCFPVVSSVGFRLVTLLCNALPGTMVTTERSGTRYHYDSHDQLHTHLTESMDA